MKNKRMFLKRCEYPLITLSDLRVGSTISIYSRQLKIANYGDTYTKKLIESKEARTLGIIKPDAYTHVGKIIDIIYKSGFTINHMKMFKWSLDQAKAFYADQSDEEFFDEIAKFMSSDVAIGLELSGNEAVDKWLNLIGPSNSLTARASAPNTIRALFGTDALRNAVHGSSSSTSATREIDFVFNPPTNFTTTALFNNCTCLMIKPDAIQAGYSGKIIDTVLEEGFEISAMEQFKLNQTMAEEFFELYKGVLPEFIPMIEHVISGPVIVMEIRQENAVQAIRKLVGPHDPEIARQSNTGSIRARYGKDRIRNVVHCTDLPEDGVLESEYFFSILQKK